MRRGIQSNFNCLDDFILLMKYCRTYVTDIFINTRLPITTMLLPTGLKYVVEYVKKILCKRNYSPSI